MLIQVWEAHKTRRVKMSPVAAAEDAMRTTPSRVSLHVADMVYKKSM
jgi:hypothetical protein